MIYGGNSESKMSCEILRMYMYKVQCYELSDVNQRGPVTCISVLQWDEAIRSVDSCKFQTHFSTSNMLVTQTGQHRTHAPAHSEQSPHFPIHVHFTAHD